MVFDPPSNLVRAGASATGVSRRRVAGVAAKRSKPRGVLRPSSNQCGLGRHLQALDFEHAPGPCVRPALSEEEGIPRLSAA